jgi:hypothetical protein
VRHGLTTLLAFSASLLCATSAAPCKVTSLPTATELVDQASVIVVAVARELVPKEPIPPPRPYRSPDLPAWLPTPHQPARRPEPEPFPSLNSDPRRATHIRFEVTETLKGTSGKALLIQGQFSPLDDFNDVPASSNSVRPQGGGGTCYASSYRRNGSYLLMLKKAASGRLSPYWSALSRVNDQVRRGRDPWLEWVRQRVAERPVAR